MVPLGHILVVQGDLREQRARPLAGRVAPPLLAGRSVGGSLPDSGASQCKLEVFINPELLRSGAPGRAVLSEPAHAHVIQYPPCHRGVAAAMIPLGVWV